MLALLVLSILLILPILLLWLFIFAAGAARLAYNTHSSMTLGTIAFILSPLYYIYHGFTE